MFTILTTKLGWKCHTRDLRIRIQGIPQTPSEKPQTEKKNPNGWVGGSFRKEPPTHPLCQILSLAENPRWSRVWQYKIIQGVILGR